jgi:hypothetical protein
LGEPEPKFSETFGFARVRFCLPVFSRWRPVFPFSAPFLPKSARFLPGFAQIRQNLFVFVRRRRFAQTWWNTMSSHQWSYGFVGPLKSEGFGWFV